MNARAVTFSVRQGSRGVEVALKILRGEPLRHLYLVPNTVITRANLDQYVRVDLPHAVCSPAPEGPPSKERGERQVGFPFESVRETPGVMGDYRPESRTSKDCSDGRKE